MREAGEPLPDELHQRLYPVAVEDTRRMDLRPQHQTLRIYQQMPLSSLHLLPGIVASLVPAYPCGLDALGIDDGGAGLRVPPEAYSYPAAECLVQPLPRIVEPPEAEVVLEGLPRREVVGQ